MLIGLLGYAGAGKDTVAGILAQAVHPILGTPKPFERRAFADKLRELALKINPTIWTGFHECWDLRDLVKRDGWDSAKRNIPEVRTLLQNLGQGAREVLRDTIWIDAVLPAPYDHHDLHDIVVTDVRYPNEAERIDTLAGRLWVIAKSGVNAVNNHASEGFAEWIGSFQYTTILNDGTLEELPFAVAAALENERKPDHLRINGATYSAKACAFVARALEQEAS